MCIPLIALSPLRTMIIDLTIVISVVVSQVSNNKCIKILTMMMTMKMMLMSNMKYEYLVWYYILCKNIPVFFLVFLFSSTSMSSSSMLSPFSSITKTSRLPSHVRDNKQSVNNNHDYNN